MEIACDSFSLINLTSCGTRQTTQQKASTLDKTKTAISTGLIIFFLLFYIQITYYSYLPSLPHLFKKKMHKKEAAFLY